MRRSQLNHLAAEYLVACHDSTHADHIASARLVLITALNHATGDAYEADAGGPSVALSVPGGTLTATPIARQQGGTRGDGWRLQFRATV